jgi:hypothetical protein
MLIERFKPTFFDQIASSASADPDGKCKELSVLEVGGKEQLKAAASDPTVAAWLGSEQAKSWAKLTPKLAGVDLRPYLFVAKDKKDYFGGSSALGMLGYLVEKLKGRKLAAQSIAEELKQLAPPDAAVVFDELRLVVVGGNSYRTKPDGIEGIAVLVEAQPQLEIKLLDLLESLPANKLGTWASGGWDSCITDPQNQVRLSELMKSWEQSGSQSLKSAINTMKAR